MIRVKNLDLGYVGGLTILHGLTFALAEGSFHFLTGKSGAGKTTLLRALYLDHRPSGGTIEMFGHDIAALPHDALPALRRRIGVVFQDFRLLDHLTVAQNVALPLAAAGQAENTYAKDVAELLDWVGLGDRQDQYPAVLSGGQKQQVAIARAVVGNPSLVLADEPTGNVDSEIGERLMWLLARLNRQGTTLVVATHDAAIRARYRQQAGELHLGDDGRLTRRAPQVPADHASAI